ncbi:MAG: hypothetical protein LBM98_08520 [Oscillospiraceae bacterium]|jgi:hypothetical protein|nr:hypothetical protein [Oscillospiraceae bacterium]
MKKKLTAFEAWLENEFWYHNKWYWLIGVMIAVFAVLTVVNNIRTPEYDWELAYVYSAQSSEAVSGADIEALLSDVLTDRNEDGKLEVNVVSFRDGDEDNGAVPTLRALNDWQYIIVVLDGASYEKYRELGYFIGEPKRRGGLYITACDGAPTLFDAKTAKAAGFNEDELDEMNARVKQEFNERLEQAQAIVERIR